MTELLTLIAHAFHAIAPTLTTLPAYVAWLVFIVAGCLTNIALEFKRYRQQLARGVPLTEQNAYLIAFGAQIVTKPNSLQIALPWAFLWAMGLLAVAQMAA